MSIDHAADASPATGHAAPDRHDIAANSRLEVGALTIDLRARRVSVDHHAVELPGKEFDLLAYLAARPGHAFSRDELLRAVWHSEPEWQQVATVTEHVGRLRTKIEVDPHQPRILTTVRGIGYRLDIPEESYDDDRFRAGLAADEFAVYYQPVVALDDLRVVTMEALVRWNHPTRGLLAPAAFIADADRSGTMIELGNVVLEKACRQGVAWRRAGIDVDVSVNLSPRELSDPGLFDRVATVLGSTGLAPDTLWLEVTETALVGEVGRASAVLHRLADIGIRIALDDFGTGSASLTYLGEFPIRALKIDRSFVAGVGRDTFDTAIARSVLALGSELGLAVIGEGIETVEQKVALQRLGCSIGQGFLFGRPKPAATARTH